MAKLRMRSRHPHNKNNKITVVRSDKGKKLHNKFKIASILLIISLACNIYLYLK